MKQKICITIPSLHGAGCERVLSEVLPYYTSYYEVDLVLLENKIKYLIPENVNVIFLDKHIPENGFLKKIPVLISIIKLFIKHFQSNKYDVIISYLDTHNIIVLISKYLAGTKVPYVVVEQTTDYLFFENSRLSKLKQYLYKFGLSVAYNRVQHIIAVSENLKQFLVKELQIKTPITVIHNGFDSEKFNLNKLDDTSNINKDFLDTKNRILCIARLDYQKNIPFLIDSFALIKEKLPESNLFILGHGEQIDDIKKKITSMELSNRVFLLGFRTNPEEYLKLSNLFVLSSRYESFGNVLVEALACGIPVLTTNYGEVVHEIMPTSDYGIVVEQGSTKHFSEAISDIVLKGTFDKNKIAKYAVENFDIRKIANQYVESIENEILTNKQALM